MNWKYVFMALAYAAFILLMPFACTAQIHYNEKFRDYLEQKQ